MKYTPILLVLFALLVAACTQVGPSENETPTGEVIFNEDIFNDEDDIFADDEAMDEDETMDEPEEEVMEEPEEELKTLEYTEGDLIALALSAEDPDGDEITFTYSDPFSRNGRWQTEEGDAGTYIITVTADDGTTEVSKDVRIIINAANRAPTLECPETINVREGETVFIDCTIFDVDGDDKDLIVGFTGWMDTAVMETGFDDAGEHTVIVRATDAFDKSATAEVTVEVEDVNRPPRFIEPLEDIEVMEEDLIILDVQAIDPDNDDLTIEYSEPFDEDGQWKTELGDAGTYNAYVTLSDGTETIQEDFEVIVNLLNTAPVFKEIPDITLDEGETVKIDVDATDREGNRIIVEFEGWMDRSEKATTFEDAYPNGCDEKGCTATYETTVTVSDGTLSKSQTVTISVRDKNRPPVFSFE